MVKKTTLAILITVLTLQQPVFAEEINLSDIKGHLAEQEIRALALAAPLMESDYYVIKSYDDYVACLKYVLHKEPKVLKFRFYMDYNRFEQEKFDLGKNCEKLGFSVSYNGELTYGAGSRYFEAVYNMVDYFKILTEAERNAEYTDEEYRYLYSLAEKALFTMENVKPDKKIRYNKEHLYDILDRVRKENGGLLYTNSTGYVSYYNTGYIDEIGFYNGKDLAKLKKMRAETEAKADAVIKRIIKDGMTELQKEKAIHDYLVTNARYDYESFLRDSIPEESYTPYGVLIKGKGVCSGYARAAALLLDKAGIESMLQDGFANNYGAHEWNKVKIDGVWYHLDVTFDDPVPDQGSKVSYDYFNLTDEEIRKDHSWDW